MEDSLDLKPFLDEAKNLVIANEEKKSEAEFYLNSVTFIRVDGDKFIISAPSILFKDMLKKSLVGKLEIALKNLTGHDFKIEIEVLSSFQTPSKESNYTSIPSTKEFSSSNIILNKQIHDTGLNPLMTFDNYVVGEENKLAYNTAVAISKNPGSEYNPFFLYGSVGLGKTHLMHAIGNAIKENFPDANIRCIPSETFVSEFVNHVLSNSSKNNAMKKFKEYYRNLDILLLDDIYDLQGKEESQEELFHTFNQLYDHKKQMVFTCDRPPRELKKFNERLISRFVRGAIRDLRVPSWETRLAILKRKSENLPFKISEEILKFIATNITSNVRDLESALTNIKAYAELIKEEITLDTVQKAIKPISNNIGFGNISIDTIQKVTASFFNLSIKDLKDKRKNQAIVVPRQIAMYIAREMTEKSTTDIGYEFGGRDHTTVMHALNKIESKIKTDSKMESLIQNLINLCREQHSLNS